MAGDKGVLFLYGQSWLHPGAGASTEAIDLPVQREVHTKYPVIPASSVKGSLREVAEETVPQGVVDSIFGPGVGTDEHFAGALSRWGCQASTLSGQIADPLVLLGYQPDCPGTFQTGS